MRVVVENYMGKALALEVEYRETFSELQERLIRTGFDVDVKDLLHAKTVSDSDLVLQHIFKNQKKRDNNSVFCMVHGCANSKLSTPHKTFFEFPEDDPRRCHQWVLYCQRFDEGPGKKRLNVDGASAICSDHFTADQFVKNTTTLLKRTAVPSVPMVTTEPRFSYEIVNGYELPEVNGLNVGEDIHAPQEIPLHLCRLCACASLDYVALFSEEGQKLKLVEKINLCLPLNVEMTDGFPKQVCRLCINKLEDLFQLQDMCSLAQEKLLDDLENSCTVNEEITVVALDKAGEEIILRSVEKNVINNEVKIEESWCPLCVDGRVLIKNKSDEGCNTSLFSELDSLYLEEADQNNSSDKVHDVFSDFHGQLNINNLENSLKVVNEKSSHANTPTNIFDVTTSDLERDHSLDGFCKEEIDPLKSDSPRSNEPSNDCYSSFASPLSLMSNDEAAVKNLRYAMLSPIKELTMEPESHILDKESETLYMEKGSPTLNDDCIEDYFSCRICGFQFSGIKELLEHSFAHSCIGFYQCCYCVTFFKYKQDLEKHFECHEASDSNVLTCSVCQKTFNTPLSLASHNCKALNNTEGNDYNKCPICSKLFRNEDRLKSHMKHHEISNPSYCHICNKLFSDEVKLQKHNLHAHSNKQSHCCGECGKVFKSEASMRYHQRTHQDEDSGPPYICDRCGKTFNRKSMLANHLLSHRHTNFETSCFTCKLCYESFPTTETAIAHLERHPKFECLDETSYSFEMYTINRLFVCEYCERCYTEGHVLDTHRDQHAEQVPYECKVCGSSFGSAEDMKLHYDNHTQDEIPEEYLTTFSIPKTYLCEYCERCFLNSNKYNEHLTIHYGTHPYQCRHCPEKFTALIEALKHRAFHGDISVPYETFDPNKPFQCHYCTKSFGIEDALIKHIRMHTGEKPFICDICGKAFSQSSGLYTHQKVHSSLRPYLCPHCPRTFKIKGDRDVHVRKHSGARPYKCDFCSQAFMTQHVYSQHRKIHTGERPYKCDVCGVLFRRSHVLTVHKRIHTGEKPHVCDICNKSYRQKGDMVKHKRIQHGVISSIKKVVNPFINC